MHDNEKFLDIKGARENNLKNISLKIPKNKLVVLTGLSGSGKSSLAFNTIYEEGRRRYVDSLGSYARMFLGGTSKPDVDSIDGLSPSISIEQKTTHNNPRSTVGTVTEIYDYFRLLFARVGKPFCPTHKIEISSQTTKDIIDSIFENPENAKLIIYAPVVENEKGTHANLLAKLQKEGYIRVRVDGQSMLLEDEIKLEKNQRHNIELTIDRLVLKEENRLRIATAVDIAAEKSGGTVIVENVDTGEMKTYSKTHSCPYKDFDMPPIETRLFSFNSPFGMCDNCKGLGVDLKASFDAIVPEDWRTIKDGGIKIFENTYGTMNLEWQEFKVMLDYYDIPVDLPISDMTKKQIEIISYGSTEEIEFVLETVNGNKVRRSKMIEGIINKIERQYIETSSEQVRDYLKKYMRTFPCSQCKGSRLNKKAMSVLVHGMNIYDLTKMSIDDCLAKFAEIPFTEVEKSIGNLILNEINNRLSFLKNVGLDYLTLNRTAETLSGGESQRIRLATQIGSNLSGVLYVLDEPSIGLHQKDNQKLIDALRKMVEIGNTLIVVEHDEETIFAADYVVDIGPGAGVHGGEVVAAGKVDEVAKVENSITGQYLSGKMKIEVPLSRRSGNGQVIVIKGAQENNLKDIDVKIPLGKLVAVTGVSGSGKSTLVNSILVSGIESALGMASAQDSKRAKFDSISGLHNVDKIIAVSQSPIGRTPRSNPATYVGVFDEIREVFSAVEESRNRGYTKSRFSFNVSGGRCEKCSGDGSIKIEMHFLPDVFIPCDQCDGKRYNHETLEIKYNGKTIADVLDMTVDEAMLLFDARPKIKTRLQTLKDVGLSYIKLGQSSTTLSGGEAQRVKLALYLQKKPTGKTIYVLDEPTTGLHTHDVAQLIKILNRIVDGGDSIVVIEHNLDVIKCADYIVDLGPDGGVNGGRLVASGTPEQVAEIPGSYTGQFLSQMLQKR
ncbi:excinuclease ABC subunit UvrA [Mycoplasma sp. Ms02]|uniref:excinuclease ABC subunit UvrA n=1 Tax=Mycoplasma sp. Ms02 TaxID=353851 RepID=UPI001C8A573E|nr:excinuclease ABC subunit UvrA [Mycoplasma sp. Ms02]QZE12086.1 excinuclease ABC subunit UvrA [Mycoplasma sp. Ms02]